MNAHQAHIPGTEPTSRELVKARYNLRRDHVRHRLTNLANRLTALSARTHGLDSDQAHRLEAMLDTIEDAMNKQADA